MSIEPSRCFAGNAWNWCKFVIIRGLFFALNGSGWGDVDCAPMLDLVAADFGGQCVVGFSGLVTGAVGGG